MKQSSNSGRAGIVGFREAPWIPTGDHGLRRTWCSRLHDRRATLGDTARASGGHVNGAGVYAGAANSLRERQPSRHYCHVDGEREAFDVAVAVAGRGCGHPRTGQARPDGRVRDGLSATICDRIRIRSGPPTSAWTQSPGSIPSRTVCSPSMSAPASGHSPSRQTKMLYWASGAGGIVRIDPLTNDVTFRSDVGMGSLHFAFDGIWATEGTNLLRIDPATGSTTTTVFTTREPLEPRVLGCGISVAEGSLWLNCGEDLYRVDPTTTDVIATLQDVGPSARVVSAEGGTWVLTGLEPFGVPSNDLAYSRLDRLDTASNEIVAGTAIRLVHGASAAGDTADGRAIWFSTTFGDPPGAGMLYKFDSTSGQVTSAYDISEGMGCGSNAIAFAYGSLWTASGSCNAVRRFPGIVP